MVRPDCVPVTFSLASGGLSPTTWALIVRRPWLPVDVVSPMSSVARTEKLYVPGFRLNGVV